MLELSLGGGQSEEASGLSQLASELQKKSQNLYGVLRDMQAAQLLRRDELGRNVLFFPAP